MKWVKKKKNTHLSIFPQNLKFSFSQNFGGIWWNEIRYNEVFTKTLKYIMSFILKHESNSNTIIK